MKLYLSDADFAFILSDLQRKLPSGPGPHYDRRLEIISKLLKAKEHVGKEPVVGAINVTGDIAEFVDASSINASPDTVALLQKLTRFPTVTQEGKLTIYIDRQAMLATLRRAGAPFEVMEAAKKWAWIPAPNPSLDNERNALGQTQDQFWYAVDMMMEGANVA